MSRTQKDQRLVEELGEKAENRLKMIDKIQGELNGLVEFIMQDEMRERKPVSTSDVFGKIAMLRAKDDSGVHNALREEIDYLRSVNVALSGDSQDMNRLREKMAYDRDMRRNGPSNPNIYRDNLRF